ncbi:sialate O-acetylesterase [Paludibacter jiangxiensis]|uniref:Sialate O-acetylesterase n=1 Tax=Paludibacter jiangxiensis TaxID=681398 RepID=A0A171A929_9BACT|nr:sialate O-acetylesterase [Paludibacter jiangxiensis]GAT63408.1 sialate O-acetylesterase [Paludibacter jiangxiensis]
MKFKLLILSVLLASVSAFGEVKLPKLISDGMVLQRNAKVKIWGWASGGEKVTVQFIGATYQTTANALGEWSIMLSDLKAGGPYTMQIDGNNSITVKDIAVGDVWVCSGQSNMGLSMGALASVYPDDIAKSENSFIRQFYVPSGYRFDGRDVDYKSGQWKSASPQNLRMFTAAGYYFALNLYRIYKVPIGLINASLGGSSAEAWISEEAIKSFPKYYEDALRFKDPGWMKRINKQDNERVVNWNHALRQNDAGYKSEPAWTDPKLNTSDWSVMHVPGYWPESQFGAENGVFWFRREVEVPASMAGKAANIRLGRIVDADSVFINGRFIGGIGSQYSERNYKIPEGVLHEGSNTIVVRIINYIRHGGFVPGKKYELTTGGQTINLEGDWKYKAGFVADPLEERLFTGKIPTALFNSMLAPMLNYRIKGVLWYQGESNTSKAFEHFSLFKTLISDWRNQWQQGDFPFIYAQLPNFVEVNIESTKYDWAYLRETQLKTLSAVPNTGMAVSIDIGEWNDIHPVNKKDLGARLALAARKVAYGENKIVYLGPIYRTLKIAGNQVILSFTNTGSGMVARNGKTLNCFEVCGKDGNYLPAEAHIVGNSVIVSSSKVSQPVAVRYAWSNNPEGANLYNKEGLPASPFRTSELY